MAGVKTNLKKAESDSESEEETPKQTKTKKINNLIFYIYARCDS